MWVTRIFLKFTKIHGGVRVSQSLCIKLYVILSMFFFGGSVTKKKIGYYDSVSLNILYIEIEIMLKEIPLC